MRRIKDVVFVVGIGFCLAVTAACELAGVVERRFK